VTVALAEADVLPFVQVTK
jgi:hypothetical protein